MSDQKHKVRAAVYAILRKGDEVLFLRRQNTGFMDGKLGLPAGHLEANESLVEGMIREAKEEVGVNISADDAGYVFTGHRYEPESIYDYIDCYFLVEQWQGEPVNNEPEKASGLEWVNINELPSDVIPYEIDHLSAWLVGETYVSKPREDESAA